MFFKIVVQNTKLHTSFEVLGEDDSPEEALEAAGFLFPEEEGNLVSLAPTHSSTRSQLPADYEACGECGWDYAYEPTEAARSHQAMMMDDREAQD